MWWTIVLTATGIAGLWLVARHWQGWVLYLLNEVLWFAYALRIHAQPLMIMAVIWGLIGFRNLKVARELSRTSNLPVVRPKFQRRRKRNREAARYLRRMCRWYPKAPYTVIEARPLKRLA